MEKGVACILHPRNLVNYFQKPQFLFQIAHLLLIEPRPMGIKFELFSCSGSLTQEANQRNFKIKWGARARTQNKKKNEKLALGWTKLLVFQQKQCWPIKTHKSPILAEIGIDQHLRQLGLVPFVVGFNKPGRWVLGCSLFLQSAQPSDLLFGS